MIKTEVRYGSSEIRHCEIPGSYLQQHHQHQVFRAHFYANPHSQSQAKKEERLSSHISRSNFTASEVTDNTALICPSM